MKKKNLKSLRLAKISVSNLNSSLKGGTEDGLATRNCSIHVCGPNDNTNVIVCTGTCVTERNRCSIICPTTIITIGGNNGGGM